MKILVSHTYLAILFIFVKYPVPIFWERILFTNNFRKINFKLYYIFEEKKKAKRICISNKYREKLTGKLSSSCFLSLSFFFPSSFY